MTFLYNKTRATIECDGYTSTTALFN